MDELRVLSIYEGFFSGGARIVHSDVVLGLHEGGQRHAVLSVNGEMYREETRQRMEDDVCYRSLTAAGVPVTSLGRTPGHPAAPRPSPDRSWPPPPGRWPPRTSSCPQGAAARPAQPGRSAPAARRGLSAPLRPREPGAALDELRTAVADGRIAAGICCAESTRAAYAAAGIPAGLLHVIPNGVDLLRFRPDPFRRALLRTSLGIPERAPVIVFAARYATMKNVPLFLRAARAWLRRQPDGHVLMCGAGMTRANDCLRADIATAFGEDAPLADRLSLLGVRHDMETVYAAADVVSLTSASGEAAPLCLIEGMMCGAVPVATDVGDSASIVTGHGFLTPPDPEAIALAWSEAVARGAEFAPALALSRERFSRTRMIAAYTALIEQVRSRSGRVPLPEPF